MLGNNREKFMKGNLTYQIQILSYWKAYQKTSYLRDL